MAPGMRAVLTGICLITLGNICLAYPTWDNPWWPRDLLEKFDTTFEELERQRPPQSAYPPNHYIRHVPLAKIHLFTFCQVLQLAVLCGLGLSAMPYLEMIFPIVLLALLPIRHRLMPLLIDPKYIRALDAAHTDNH
uniref:Bicarbonate transporter-like transmembrane domain-containing protein n=1 Tax=Branchiostoma floridae TaxID=7739 RepID=C3YQ67_BRAFL|eukprot:XP_002601559.1 hypothetical protein BRAFLDRAFT_95798 [Branchiostoma floridae]